MSTQRARVHGAIRHRKLAFPAAGVLALVLLLGGSDAQLLADEPPTSLRLAGLVSFSSNKLALIESSPPGRERTDLVLAEGEREGDLEVLKIDDLAEKVSLNRGTRAIELAFDANRDPGGLVEGTSPKRGTLGQTNQGVRFRLQKAGLRHVLEVYQRLSRRSLLRSSYLPGFRLDLSSSGLITVQDFLKAIDRELAAKGIFVRPGGEKFAIVAREGDFQAITPQIRKLAEALDSSGGKTSAEAAPRTTRPAETIPPGELIPTEMIPPGEIDFRGVGLPPTLVVYGELAHRTLIEAPSLPGVSLIFRNQEPISRVEALYVFTALFALDGISVVPSGDKFLMVFPTRQTNTAASLLARQSPACGATNGAIAPLTDHFQADLPSTATTLAKLCGCPVELDPGLPHVILHLRTQSQLTHGEVLRAFDLLLGWHGLRIVQQPDGKGLRIVRSEKE